MAGQDLSSLQELDFLAGCWQGPFGSGERAGTMEEFWTSPSRNLILGTTRYIREGRTVSFEFSRIEVVDGGVVLTPYPNGRPSEDGFRLTSLGTATVTFEAPEHDFPRRIIYRDEPPGGDERVARIDDGTDDGRVQEWRLRRVPCPGGA